MRQNEADQLQGMAMTASGKPSEGEIWRARLWPFEVLGWVTGVGAILFGVISWHLETDDRAKERHYRAWELINSARGSSGDGGRRAALEDLHEDGEDLSAAPLANAYLSKIQLPNADLRGADLSEATLSNANFRGANLSGANLSDAKLRPMPGIISRTRDEDGKAWIVGGKLIGFTDLSGANLSEANLTNADLLGANLSRANLTQANLTGADLAGADLTNADFFRAILFNASLAVADMTEADMTMAELTGANLYAANLTGAKFTECNLKDVKFCKTIMPDGTVNNRDCPPELAPPISSEMALTPN